MGFIGYNWLRNIKEIKNSFTKKIDEQSPNEYKIPIRINEILQKFNTF